MGRAEDRMRKRAEVRLANEMAKKPQQWEEVAQSEINRIVEVLGNKFRPDRMYKNHLYSVQVFGRLTDWGPFEKAMIRRHDSKPIHDWKAIQQIKNDLWGDHVTALEVYPKEEHKVDVANIYWIWVMADGRDCPVESRRGRII